jgi:hypothetical protein
MGYTTLVVVLTGLSSIISYIVITIASLPILIILCALPERSEPPKVDSIAEIQISTKENKVVPEASPRSNQFRDSSAEYKANVMPDQSAM